MFLCVFRRSSSKTLESDLYATKYSKANTRPVSFFFIASTCYGFLGAVDPKIVKRASKQTQSSQDRPTKD